MQVIGIKGDGTLSYFFHKTFKADEKNSQKRRKILNDDLGAVCWQKIGKTKPVYVDGIHRGSKKVMVLYMSKADNDKPERTNWVMHQYHVGAGKDAHGGLVISKIFYQLNFGQSERNMHDVCINAVEAVDMEAGPEVSPKAVDPECHVRNSNSILVDMPNQVSVDLSIKLSYSSQPVY